MGLAVERVDLGVAIEKVLIISHKRYAHEVQEFTIRLLLTQQNILRHFLFTFVNTHHTLRKIQPGCCSSTKERFPKQQGLKRPCMLCDCKLKLEHNTLRKIQRLYTFKGKMCVFLIIMLGFGSVCFLKASTLFK